MLSQLYLKGSWMDALNPEELRDSLPRKQVYSTRLLLESSAPSSMCDPTACTYLCIHIWSSTIFMHGLLFIEAFTCAYIRVYVGVSQKGILCSDSIYGRADMCLLHTGVQTCARIGMPNNTKIYVLFAARPTKLIDSGFKKIKLLPAKICSFWMF